MTLPIIRDTVSVVQNVPQSSHFNPQIPINNTSVAVYWTAGILPILRRLHQSNLSATMDLGSPGFLHILFDSHVARSLERFVATSLKLCTETLASPRLRQTKNPSTLQSGVPAPQGSRRSLKSLDQIRPFQAISPEIHAKSVGSLQSEGAQGPQQSERLLAPEQFLSDRTSGSDTHYFRDITPIAVSHAQFNAPQREQPRAYVHSFEKEPQRYSGVSVQPSQRASIGIAASPNSNGMPDHNEVHPLNRMDNYSAGLLTHDAQKTSATPSIAPSSKTFSSSSTHDRQATDTEISTFMPSVFGSIQELPLTPSWTVGYNRSDALIGKAEPIESFSTRRSVPPTSAPLEEVKSIRQKIALMKSERQNPGKHRHEGDNKSNAPPRLSGKFSWIGRNSTKAEPDTNPEVTQKAHTNISLHPNSMLSEEARIPHTPMLNNSFHARIGKETLNGTHDPKETLNDDPETKVAMSNVADPSLSLPLITMVERDGNFDRREDVSGGVSGRHDTDEDHPREPLRNSDMGEPETNAELKRASKWGFALKSLSLSKSHNPVRTEEHSKKGSRKSWKIKPENATSTFLPPSIDALSMKISTNASRQTTDAPSQKAIVPDSLVRGLSAPYETIYEPASLQFQFEFLEMPKDSIPWPWGDPVPFWKGTPVHKLSWGGFEVDLVGVRQGITKNVSLLTLFDTSESNSKTISASNY